MGRKNLGGTSSLQGIPLESDEWYNSTLENVYETALASIDTGHKKKRRKLPNIFSLCIRSAQNDVDEMATSSMTTTSDHNVASVTDGQLWDEDDALFVGDDEGSRNRKRGLVKKVSTNIRRALSNVSSRRSYTNNAIYDL